MENELVMASISEQKLNEVGRNVSAIMQKVHSGDTGPELTFRKALWANGLRYRIRPVNLIGKPDVVIMLKRIAVFIDGDYWHGGQWRRRNLTSLEDQFSATSSKDYWLKKIRKNMDRDCRTTATLVSEGWIVLRFWESQIQKNLGECVEMVLKIARHGVEPTPFSTAPQKTFAEFFSGIGLIRMGLERQGWTIKFANDIDPQKYEMYKEQFTDADNHSVLGDIHEIPIERVPSFPCNDLSLAGSRNGLSGKQSSAFWGFIRILEEMGKWKPPIILLENVLGFLTSHNGKDFNLDPASNSQESLCRKA